MHGNGVAPDRRISCDGRQMLILPVGEQQGRSRQPLVLLLLIVLNVVVYFATLGRDNESARQAYSYYLESDLPSIELSRYVSEQERRQRHDAHSLRAALDGKRPFVVLQTMENDAGFMRRLRAQEIVRPDASEYAHWRTARQRYETLRERGTSQRFGFKPAAPTFSSLIVHMFLHGSLMHLIGNMAVLFAVGRLVEETLGKSRFLLFYLLCGCGGAALDWVIDTQRMIPGIGASGAISGVMAMFVMLYGRRKIRFFYWLLIYFDFFTAPAILMLPVWMGWELYQYLNAGNSQVNYLAHLGGFLSGTLLIAAQRRLGRELSPRPAASGRPTDDTLSAERQRLAAHLENLRFEAAMHSARRCTRLAPDDVGLLDQYYMLARAQPAGDDYHRAAAQIFALATKAEHSEFVHRTFKDYLQTARPAVRIKSAQLAMLARAFARHGHLDDAERLSLALARREADHAALPALLLLLAESHRRTGDRTRYEALLERLRREHPGSEEAQRGASL